jgi:uncharacterized protein (TIGR02757 family)
MLRRRLDELVADVDVPARLAADPVGLVRAYAGADDREVAGLLAASLAFGNVVAIRRSVRRALDLLGESPAAAVGSLDERELRRRFRGFVHRVWTGRDVARMLARAGAVRREHGSLGRAFRVHLDAAPDFREALARFADDLRGPVARATPTLRHLVPDPRAGSACKRLLLYLRWMTRPADGVDLGLWPVPASALVIPVDVHVHRIARNLGLTTRNDASWRTAEEITARLRTFDPADPVKYDFAICHLGVSRACPSRRDPERCAPCSLRPVCIHHRK